MIPSPPTLPHRALLPPKPPTRPASAEEADAPERSEMLRDAIRPVAQTYAALFRETSSLEEQSEDAALRQSWRAYVRSGGNPAETDRAETDRAEAPWKFGAARDSS